MIQSLLSSRTAFLLPAMVLKLFVCALCQQPSVAPHKVPLCAKPSKDQSFIGWGKYGLFFSVPKREVEISGGEPDVDYVRFIIKPMHHKTSVELWFGPTAFHPDPPRDILDSTTSSTQTKLLNADGNEIGLDTRGRKHDNSSWRWFGVWAEGAVYENSSAEDVVLFDRIIDSACVIPYPNR